MLPEVKKDGVYVMFPPKSWRGKSWHGKSWREMRPKDEDRTGFAPVEMHVGINGPDERLPLHFDYCRRAGQGNSSHWI